MACDLAVCCIFDQKPSSKEQWLPCSNNIPESLFVIEVLSSSSKGESLSWPEEEMLNASWWPHHGLLEITLIATRTWSNDEQSLWKMKCMNLKLSNMEDNMCYINIQVWTQDVLLMRMIMHKRERLVVIPDEKTDSTCDHTCLNEVMRKCVSWSSMANSHENCNWTSESSRQKPHISVITVPSLASMMQANSWMKKVPIMKCNSSVVISAVSSICYVNS